MFYYIFLLFFAVFTIFPLHLYSDDGKDLGVESFDLNSFEKEEADRLFKKMIFKRLCPGRTSLRRRNRK